MMQIPEYPSEQRPGFCAAQLDRLGHWRQQAELREPHLNDAGIILVSRYQMPIRGAQVHLLPAVDFAERLDSAIWLGMWRERSIYTLAISHEEAQSLTDLRFADLRGAAMRLDPDDAAVLAYARAMVYWQRQHRHCGRCGAANTPSHAGHVMVCTPCKQEHYPRSDPSMLVQVSDSADRCLLGRQAGWAPGFWSVLAGFVEPGESIEDAVIREVWEESRICVTGMRYHASQAWPFPASVLLGYHAVADDATPQVDQDDLEAADWYSRDRIIDELAARSLYMPPAFTLSYRLIESWFDRDDGGIPLAQRVRGAR